MSGSSKLLLVGVGPAAAAAAFVPTDIAGLELWLKADAGTSTTVDGAAISQWNDQSGNANHATQGGGTAQPIYKAAIVNGLPVVRFDRSNDELVVSALTNNDATRTMFVVAKGDGTDAAGGVWGFGNDYALQNFNTAWRWKRDQANAIISLGGNPAVFQVITIKVSSTSSLDGYINAGSATNLDPNNSISAGGLTWSVGHNAGTASFFGGDVAEFLMYNSALSDTDRGNVISYLMTKYGL